MLYFAYGSNMNNEQMAFRCPTAIPYGAAVLQGYRLCERQHADVEISPRSKVHGVLWSINLKDLQSLDHYEGYPVYYTRTVAIVEFGGQLLPAIVYEMTARFKVRKEGLKFAPFYKRDCSAGALAHKLPFNFYQDE